MPDAYQSCYTHIHTHTHTKIIIEKGTGITVPEQPFFGMVKMKLLTLPEKFSSFSCSFLWLIFPLSIFSRFAFFSNALMWTWEQISGILSLASCDARGFVASVGLAPTLSPHAFICQVIRMLNSLWEQGMATWRVLMPVKKIFSSAPVIFRINEFMVLFDLEKGVAKKGNI